MIVTKKLNCGATLVMEQIPFIKSVAVGMWAKVGSVNETENLLGISHFIEHMIFKGTEKRSTKAIAEDIDKIGGQINAFTGKEYTCYYVRALDSHLEEASDVLFDIFFNSTFDEEEMEKEKSVIYEEISMHEDSPEDDIHDVVYNTVFKDTPLCTPILGTKETLSGISRKMILDYIDENYCMDNVVISVAGNFDEAQLVNICESKFKKLREKSQQKAKYSDIYVPSQLFKKKDIEQAHVCLATKGVKLEDEYYHTLATLNTVVGGSMSSRLFQSIREDHAMAYSVYSYATSYVNDGVFAVYAGVNPSKINDVVDCVKKEFGLLKAKGITIDELSSSKEQLKSNHIFGMENVSSRMFSLGRSQLLRGRTFSQEEVIAKIDAVNMEKIDIMIEKFTDMSKYSGALLSKEKVELNI